MFSFRIFGVKSFYDTCLQVEKEDIRGSFPLSMLCLWECKHRNALFSAWLTLYLCVCILHCGKNGTQRLRERGGKKELFEWNFLLYPLRAGWIFQFERARLHRQSCLSFLSTPFFVVTLPPCVHSVYILSAATAEAQHFEDYIFNSSAAAAGANYREFLFLPFHFV